MIDDRMLIYTAILMLFVLLENILPNFEKLKRPFSVKNFLDNFAYFIFNLVIAGILATAMAFSILYIQKHFKFLSGFHAISEMSWWPQLIVGFLVRDFLAYWMHRFSHSKVFWRFHLVHHQIHDLEASAAFRVHPINFLLNTSRAPILLLFGFHISVLPALGVFYFVHNIFVHANIKIDFGPLNYLFISPRLHRLHHASEKRFFEKNYGVCLSIWDLIFSTFTNETPQKIRLGVQSSKDDSFVGVMISPVIFLMKQLRPSQKPTENQKSA